MGDLRYADAGVDIDAGNRAIDLIRLAVTSTHTPSVLGGIGAVLLVFGLIAPRLLKWPSALWWKFSRALGHVMARFWLTLLFLLVLTPVSLVWKLIGRDPLDRRRDKWPGWSKYPERYRNPKHYDQMY